MESSQFTCALHSDSKIEYYCHKEVLLMCEQCLKEHQHDHNKDVVAVDQEKLREAKEFTQQNLDKIKELINNKIDKIQTQGCDSSNINDLLFIGKAYLRLQSSEDELKKEVETKFQEALKIVEVEKPQKVEKQMDSVLITSTEKENLIMKWLGFNAKFRLLLRGSKNGFKSAKFHFLCDKKGPTLTVIKNEFGYIFGGYTSKNQKSPNDIEIEKDPKCFLFSITNGSKHEPIDPQSVYIGHSPYRMNIFGRSSTLVEDSDLELNDEANIGKHSWQNLGHSFKLPENIQFGSNDANVYLTGGKSFKVVEYEVFQVKEIK